MPLSCATFALQIRTGKRRLVLRCCASLHSGIDRYSPPRAMRVAPGPIDRRSSIFGFSGPMLTGVRVARA